MEHKVQTFKGVDFKVVRGTTHPEYSYHTFEREEVDFRDSFWAPKAGEVVFDVGSSYGAYALTACSQGARVYAFEPEPTVFADLARSVDLNGWGDRCKPFNMGLYSKAGLKSMKDYAPHWPQQTITQDYQMLTLDAVVNREEITRLDWLKIDVEGAEVDVLQGGRWAIDKFLPRIIVECHVFLDPELTAKARAILAPFGYVFAEVKRDPCVMLLARR